MVSMEVTSDYVRWPSPTCTPPPWTRWLAAAPRWITPCSPRWVMCGIPVVFIVGCVDGLLPLRPSGGAEVDYAEECRLLFVGMTRASTRLVLAGTELRVVRGADRQQAIAVPGLDRRCPARRGRRHDPPQAQASRPAAHVAV